MSSEKLQALPGEPLILVTSHTFTVFFTTVPGPAHSSLWSPARAASGCKQIGILLCCLLSHNFSPCTVLTSSSRWGNPPLLPPLSSLSLSLSLSFSRLSGRVPPAISPLCPSLFLDGSFHPLSPSGLILVLSLLCSLLPLSRPLLLPRQAAQSRLKALTRSRPIAERQSQACGQWEARGFAFAPIRGGFSAQVGRTEGIGGNAVRVLPCEAEVCLNCQLCGSLVAGWDLWLFYTKEPNQTEQHTWYIW